jgi:hypothetical protein
VIGVIKLITMIHAYHIPQAVAYWYDLLTTLALTVYIDTRLFTAPSVASLPATSALSPESPSARHLSLLIVSLRSSSCFRLHSYAPRRRRSLVLGDDR